MSTPAATTITIFMVLTHFEMKQWNRSFLQKKLIQIIKSPFMRKKTVGLGR